MLLGYQQIFTFQEYSVESNSIRRNRNQLVEFDDVLYIILKKLTL